MCAVMYASTKRGSYDDLTECVGEERKLRLLDSMRHRSRVKVDSR